MRKLTYQTSVLRITSENIILSNYYYFLGIVVLLFVLLINRPYYKWYEYTLVKSDGYKLVVDENYFPIKNKYLYYNHKKYSYSVVSISDYYIINNKKYYDVNIDVKIDDKERKNIFNIFIIKNKTTLLSDFIKKIKKG